MITLRIRVGTILFLFLFLFLFLALAPLVAGATTCSCAGVPILGAMQSASPDNNQWFLASTYEFHDLSDWFAAPVRCLISLSATARRKH